jgi:putative hydrolase of the HAD superfamily
MIRHTITAILFDFGGVLAEEGFRNGLQALARQQGLNTKTILDEGMQAVYDSGFVLGTGSESDFWSLMNQRTGLSGKVEALSDQVKKGFIIRPGMIQLAKELRKQGYLTAILSDQTYWLDELDVNYHLSDVFTHIYNSYYLGKGKRDSSLFLDIAEDLEIPPESILFVDDDEGNTRRAENKGMRTIVFVDEDSFRAALEKILSTNAGKYPQNETQYQV